MTSGDMGSDVGQNPDLVKKYSAAVSQATDIPVIAKMTPNIGNMEIPAMAAIDGGADALSAINTIKSITGIDLDDFVPLPKVNGKSSISGYSGKAVKPIALRFIAELKQYPDLKDIPISGIGGIETWQDAAEFLALGARNVQVTTSVMQYGYRIVEDMINGLSNYMDKKGFESLDEMVGLALENIVSAEELDRAHMVLPDFDEEKCIGCGRCYISCYDGGHQAIEWDSKDRKPRLDDEKCVGCHLCKQICPVEGCIISGEVKFKESREKYKVE